MKDKIDYKNCMSRDCKRCNKYKICFKEELRKKKNEEDVVGIISNSHDIIRNIVDKYFEVKNEYKSKYK